MKPQFLLVVACTAVPLSLLAQAPAASPAAESQKRPPPVALEGKPTDAKTNAPSEVDPAVVEVMRKAFAAQRAKGTFRARMESASVAGMALPAVEMEFVFPNRMRMKMTGGVEVVGVGDTTMVKMGEGWMPAPAAMKSAGSNFGDPKKVDDMLSSATVAKSLGPTKIDGVSVDAYQFNSKPKEGESKSKVFILPASNLIHRIETEAEVMGKTATTTLDYYDYGAPILIELPK
jgi:hypothetical protein